MVIELMKKMEERDLSRKVVVFEGTAKLGEIIKSFAQIQLRPEDFASPLSLQMAFSRIYESMMKALSEGPKKSFVAEVRFIDSLGQNVTVGVDLGSSPPPFSKNIVKARIMIELYEEE